jgi:hypothetical protein
LQQHTAAEGCKSRTFEPCRSEAKSVDWQKLRVQEIMGTDKQQEGQVGVRKASPMPAQSVILQHMPQIQLNS